MIKSFDDENDEEYEAKPARKLFSSRIAILVGIVLLFFIAGPSILNEVTKKPARNLTSKPELLKSSPLSNLAGSLPDRSNMAAQAQSASASLGQTILKMGTSFGAAVLGTSVQFAERSASESAGKIASAAAGMILKSTAPVVIDQIKKLPPDQQNQVKEYLCK